MEKTKVSEIIGLLSSEEGSFEIEEIEEREWGWIVGICGNEVNVDPSEIFSDVENVQSVDLGIDDDFFSCSAVYLKIDTSIDLYEDNEKNEDRVVMYAAFTHSCGEYNDEDYNGNISGYIYFPKDNENIHDVHLEAFSEHQKNLLHGVVDHIRSASEIVEKMIPGSARDLFSKEEMLSFLRNISAKG